METITSTFTLTPAPETILNLRFGIVYAPLVATPHFVGYRALEVAPDEFVIDGFEADGVIREVYRTRDIFEEFRRFAIHLRMTATKDAEQLRTNVPVRFGDTGSGIRLEDAPLPPATHE